jgi:hypothetical protein
MLALAVKDPQECESTLGCSGGGTCR